MMSAMGMVHRKLLASIIIVLGTIGSVGCSSGPSEGKEVPGRMSWTSWIRDVLKPEVRDCEGLRYWMAEHSSLFRARVERSTFSAELYYRPAACVACMENQQAQFHDPGLRSRIRELGGGELYMLRFTPDEQVGDSLFDLSWDVLMDDFVEIVGSDTVPCSFLHAEAMPSMAPYRSLTLGFDRVQDGHERKLILLDRSGKFGGDVCFSFPERAVEAYMNAVPDSLFQSGS